MNCLRRAFMFGILLVAFAGHVSASSPTAAISASPVQGDAPLSVFFDGTPSSADSITFLWQFGDGAASTAPKISHIYTVAGTYVATLIVTNATGQASTAQITIVVTGTGSGPVTPNTNFRLAITSATFKLNFAQPNHDSLKLVATFNTVDLPTILNGLASQFTVNGVSSNGNGGASVSGVLGSQNDYQSALNLKPNFLITVDPRKQALEVFISKDTFTSVLASSGIVRGASGLFPVTITFTIGAQTYSVTEFFAFTANGSTSIGQFLLQKSLGGIHDGFFVVSNASAQETIFGTSHTYTFNALLSMSNGKVIQAPTSGNWVFKFNEADPIVIPFDRIKQNGTQITISQEERDLGGIRKLTLDTVARTLSFNTWDLLADVKKGGTGLPLRGFPFVGFNFTLRMDLDQPDGTTFSVVTGTRLTRRTRDDAFWQTGRRLKP